MRGALTWILAIAAGIVLVLVVTAMIGTRDDRDETVSAGTYAQSVCGAFGVWRGQIEAIVEDISDAERFEHGGQRGTAVGDATGPYRLRPHGSRARIQATETMVVAVDNAGMPDTRRVRRRQFVSDWADSALDDLEEAQESLDEEADSLEHAL